MNDDASISREHEMLGGHEKLGGIHERILLTKIERLVEKMHEKRKDIRCITGSQYECGRADGIEEVLIQIEHILNDGVH